MIEFIIISLLILCITYYLVFVLFKKEKFTDTILTEKKLYLNPPKNANTLGIIESKIKCVDNKCTTCTNNNCEGFENVQEDDDMVINSKITKINSLIGSIDNSINIIYDNMVTYKKNYNDFNKNIIDSMNQRNNIVNLLINKFGYNVNEQFEDTKNIDIDFKDTIKYKIIKEKPDIKKRKSNFIITV
jgi:hypothetical protein